MVRLTTNIDILKINCQSNINTINIESDKLISQYGWGRNNQICLTHKKNSQDIWFEGSGSLYDKTNKKIIGKELEYSIWNIDSTWYIRNQIEKLKSCENFTSGRIRLMRLLPKTGLSVHNDNEVRYHLVLKTNDNSYIAFNKANKIAETGVTAAAICFHLPADSWWYKVNTKKTHWVYNGGDTERIHLVVCET